jgi:hypothetical protein
MNFQEAMQKVFEGKKVYRKGWGIPAFLYKSRNDRVIWHDGEEYTVFKDYVLATDWEIYEEKKTVSREEAIEGFLNKTYSKIRPVNEDYYFEFSKNGHNIHCIHKYWVTTRFALEIALVDKWEAVK